MLLPLFVLAATAGACGGDDAAGEAGGGAEAGEDEGPPCGGPCPEGTSCLEDVCIDTPTIAGQLGGEERGDDGKNRPIVLDAPVNTSCWVTPDVAPDEPRSVPVRGKIDELAVGPPKSGMCVTVYRQPELLAHWAGDSRCPGLANVDERVACFRTDPCECEDMEAGAAKTACETDVGPALGFARSTDGDGAYALADVPTNEPLVLRLSGREGLWKETFMWGVEIRTDRLETDADSGEVYERFDPIGVSEGDWGVVQTLLGLASTVPPDRGAVAGELRDCGAEGRDPEPLMGASFHLDPDGIVRGFHGGDPEALTDFTPDLTESRNLGIFGSVGVPEGPNRFVAAVKLGEELHKVADYELYVPPSAGVILYVQGRVRWRSEAAAAGAGGG